MTSGRFRQSVTVGASLGALSSLRLVGALRQCPSIPITNRLKLEKEHGHPTPVGSADITL